MNKNKGLYIILFLLLLIVIGLGGYYLYTKGVILQPKEAAKTKDDGIEEVEDTKESEDMSEETKVPEKEPTKEPVAKKMTVKVFFASSVKDPNSEKCDVTYAVSRTIDQTVAVGRASLNQLLAGPSAIEKSQGYVTAIPEGTQLKSLEIKNGVAYANFNEKLNQGVGGSCSTDRIRSQIENTLKQFPTVKSVVIQVNGSANDVLQP